MDASFVVVGEALVDLVESRSARGTFTAYAGGSPYNVAVTLGRLGYEVSMLARSGRDRFGRMLEDKARGSGVRLDRWQHSDLPTTLAVAGLDEDGRAEYDFYLDGSAGLTWDDSIVDQIAPGGVLHLASLSSWRPPSAGVLQALQKRAHDDGVTLVSYDPNVRPALIGDRDTVRASIERCVANSHVVKASDEDVEFLYPGEALDLVGPRWAGLGADLVIITRGPDGAVAYSRDGEIARQAGVPIAVSDTVGAGDSFAGALLASLAESGIGSPDALRVAVAEADARIADALSQAVIVSAMTCERPGAEPPTRAELAARLSSR